MDVERFGLDERVLIASAGVVGVDVVDVEATVDVLHVAVDVGPAAQIVVVEDASPGIVAADAVVERGPPRPDVVGSEPDFRE